MTPTPTPAAFIAARLRAAARRDNRRRGWYAFAIAVLDDSPERLTAIGDTLRDDDDDTDDDTPAGT